MAKAIRRPSKIKHRFCNYWFLRVTNNGEYVLVLENTERVERVLKRYRLSQGSGYYAIAYYRKSKKTDESHRKILLNHVLSSIDVEIARLMNKKRKISRLL